MLSAVTLVHKGAMPIAVHAVNSFARHFSASYRLDIHTDGSPDSADQDELLRQAAGMETRIILPRDRQPLLEERLAPYPKTRALIDGVGYNAKLELPMAASEPYFYFDSDIVWLRPASNLIPPAAPNAFSTESWSWYNGIAEDQLWIDAKTPRRVNSGFYYLGEPFPFERMEDMLAKGMFDSNLPYNTDQEIMAYLFRNMQLYHPEDLKRSRRNGRYDLTHEASAALHFPGGMWREHLDQISELAELAEKDSIKIRYQYPEAITKSELFQMRLRVSLSDSPLTRSAVNRLRKLRQSIQR
jgi:hypothetical protein